MDGGEGEEVALTAPVDFKRMLSWQLSTPTNVPSKSRKQRRKRSKEARQLAPDDPHPSQGAGYSDEEQLDFPGGGDGEIAEYAYVYVNSDGEEEIYYSAPESPLTSEDETSTAQSVVVPPTTQQHTKERCPKKSKRSKKKARYLARVAKVEFFQPLCDLVEDKLQVEVGRLEVSSFAEVPSLTEICIRNIRSNTFGKLT